MSGAHITSNSSADTTVSLSPSLPTSDASNASQPFQPNESTTRDNNNFITIEGIGRVPVAPAPITDSMRLSNGGGTGSDDTNGLGLDLGITIMQSSPPPHGYRHSRAYRHFKNPPQPHMCIRTTNDAGEELFINVLSWTRIVIPQEPSDPIPLYGGMRVPPGSPRSPPLVFAVMANPEVLKDSGRHSKDPEERRAMVELMCDFVEAMNPGVKLVRNAVILKDRDISGELKDVWNAVQAQRDREREEQIMQQRQQQHFHNLTTQQQILPKSENTEVQLPQTSQEDEEIMKLQTTQAKVTIDQTSATANSTPTTATVTTATTIATQPHTNNNTKTTERASENNNSTNRNGVNSTASSNGEQEVSAELTPNGQLNSGATLHLPQPPQLKQNGSCDQLDAGVKENLIKSPKEETKSTASSNAKKSATPPAAAPGSATLKNDTKPAATPVAQPAPPQTRKEKLAGFLPNGCIFPRFKNHKNKDKDKDPKPKERTLLNALKKNKDKKVAPVETNATEKKTAISPSETDAKTQHEKNCISLESEVEKLNLNKIDSSTRNDVLFKLKVAATSGK